MKKYLIIVLVLVVSAFLTNTKLQGNTKSFIEEDDLFQKQWGLHNNGQTVIDQKGIKGIDINYVKALELYNNINTKNEVIVGVLDTGIDITNLELKNNIYYNKHEIPNNGIDEDHNGYIDDVNGWDFYHGDNSIYDSYLEDYRGTQVAGVISSINGSRSSNVKILPLKFMSGTSGSTLDAITAIEYAKKLGVKIINCSWETFEYDDKLKKVMEQNPQILFICSSGMHGKDLSKKPVFPACYNISNILTVTAIDNKGELYSKAGYGKEAQVSAPGVNIISTLPENEYEFTSGTSIAVPFATGVASMLKSCVPQISTKDIFEAIVNTSNINQQLESSGGIIDAYAALNYVTLRSDEHNRLSEQKP